VVALFDMTTGKKWDDKEKKLFKNPYSQFLKVETDLTKTWTLNQQSKLVGRVNAGVIYAYGNSVSAPNSELFYVGGANSVRAFPVRGVGPGGFPGLDNSTMSYLVQNGDIKLVLNLEYRRQLFGDLYGAVFLDAGNVWNMRADSETDRNGTLVGDRQFSLKNLADQMALGTGIGIRYDLTFLVVRLDWGLGLHVPYDNGGSGYFNAKTFKADQTLHFAIGYPF
jgi:outer membrane protein assembly factor BamA